MSQADDLVTYATQLIGKQYFLSGYAWYNTAAILTAAKKQGVTDPLCTDCSGTVCACMRRAGVPWKTGGTWPRITAQDLHNASLAVSDTPQIGDIYTTHHTDGSVHHVVLVVGSNTTIEADGPVVHQYDIDDPVHGVTHRGASHRRFQWVDLTGGASKPSPDNRVRLGTDHSGWRYYSSATGKVFYADHKAKGRDFVVRYLKNGSLQWVPSYKGIGSAELADANAAGVDVAFFYEADVYRAFGGSAAGSADVDNALTALSDLGLPSTTPVYYCLDWDYVHGTHNGVNGMTAVQQYFTGINNRLTTLGLGVAQVGVYGGWGAGDYLLKHGMATYFCQATAPYWSDYRGWHPLANIRQGSTAAAVIDGIKCDMDSTNGAGYFGEYPTSSGSGGTTGPPRTLLEWQETTAKGIGGILYDDDLILVLKDDAGNQMEFRGQVWDKQGGLRPTVTCRDESAYWDRGPVDLLIPSSATVADIIKQCVNPSGVQDPFICHVDDFTASSEGTAFSFDSWSGLGKNLMTILADFQTISGFRWTIESRALGREKHFWWGNPARWADWGATIRDDIDFADESGSQLRVIDSGGEISVIRDHSGYANQIEYISKVGPPVPPVGKTWDSIWTDDLSHVKPYGPVMVGLQEPCYQGKGNHSLRFDANTSGVYSEEYILPLGYLSVPAPFNDWSSGYWNYVMALGKITLVESGVGTTPDINGGAWVQLVLHSGSYQGPDPGVDQAPIISCVTPIMFNDKWASLYWDCSGLAAQTNSRGDKVFDPTNIRWIEIQLALNLNPVVYGVGFNFDQFAPLGNTVVPGVTAGTGPTTQRNLLSSAAVEAGLERPITATLDESTLGPTDAGNVAAAYLQQVQRTKVTIPQVPLAGIRYVPLNMNIPLGLTRTGITGASFPPVEIDYLWGEAGDRTVLMLGDTPLSQLRLLEGLRHHLDRIGKGG